MTGIKRSLSGENQVSDCKRPCNSGNIVQSPQVIIIDWFTGLYFLSSEKIIYKRGVGGSLPVYFFIAAKSILHIVLFQKLQSMSPLFLGYIYLVWLIGTGKIKTRWCFTNDKLVCADHTWSKYHNKCRTLIWIPVIGPQGFCKHSEKFGWVDIGGGGWWYAGKN